MHSFSAVWEVTTNVAIVLVPFIITFLAWVTSQLFDLKSTVALLKQVDAGHADAIADLKTTLREIQRQQQEILLAIRRLETLLEKNSSAS